MTQSKHTPGPWDIKPGRDHKNNITILDRANNLHITYVTNDGDTGYYIDEGIQQANARLIAAAPELLSALEFILSDENSNIDYEAGLIIRAAIAKAKVEQVS